MEPMVAARIACSRQAGMPDKQAGMQATYKQGCLTYNACRASRYLFGIPRGTAVGTTRAVDTTGAPLGAVSITFDDCMSMDGGCAAAALPKVTVIRPIV